jgi:RNA polymerase sigma factor (sigma-70 family)
MEVEAVATRRRDRLSVAMLRRASDECLVEQVRAGSERAFEVLVDRHGAALLAFCRRMLGSREEAEDAVQQTFVAAYRELASRDESPDLRPWLYGIARHRCLSALRSGRRRAFAELPDPVADNVLGDVTMREDLRAVLADVARLPRDQRAALVLAEFCDLSHAEIAPIVGCSRDKVKALVFQARSSLTAERAARETPCTAIREQLRTGRGGALRRAVLRRHLRECPACRAFRETLRSQRRQLRVLLPLGPVIGLPRAVFGAWFGAGGGGATVGGALTAAGLSGGLTAALVTVAIPALALPVSSAGPRTERATPPQPASVSPAGKGHAPTRTGGAERAAPRPGRRRGAAVAPVRPEAQTRERPVQSANATDTSPASLRPPAEEASGDEDAKSVESHRPAEHAEVPEVRQPVEPVTPTPANDQIRRGKQPEPRVHAAPANPPAPNGQGPPATPPGANEHAPSAKPDEHAPPGQHAPGPPAPAGGRDPAPSPAIAGAPGAAGGGNHVGDDQAPSARGPSGP